MAYVKSPWLDAVGTNQTTDPEEVTGTSRYGLQASVTGGPSSLGIALQGSINGTNWITLATLSAAGTTWSNPESAGPVRYIRLDLYSLSGGSSPTVTASVIAI